VCVCLSVGHSSEPSKTAEVPIEISFGRLAWTQGTATPGDYDESICAAAAMCPVATITVANVAFLDMFFVDLIAFVLFLKCFIKSLI